MKNLLESAVREVHVELLKHHREFCHCSRCADDVAAYVLNHVRPRYATSAQGWAMENADLVSDQTRAELAVVVLDAIRRVAARPRHTPANGVSSISD